MDPSSRGHLVCALDSRRIPSNKPSRRIGVKCFRTKFQYYVEQVLGSSISDYDENGHVCGGCECTVNNYFSRHSPKDNAGTQNKSKDLSRTKLYGPFQTMLGCLPIQLKKYIESCLNPISPTVLVLHPLWFRITLTLSPSGSLLSHNLILPSLAYYVQIGGGIREIELWPFIVDYEDEGGDEIEGLDHVSLLAYHRQTKKMILYDNGQADELNKDSDSLFSAVSQNLVGSLRQSLFLEVEELELFKFKRDAFRYDNCCFISVIYVIKEYLEGISPPRQLTTTKGDKFVQDVCTQMEKLDLRVALRVKEIREDVEKTMDKERKEDKRYCLEYFKILNKKECILLNMYKNGMLQNDKLDLPHLDGFMKHFSEDCEGFKLILAILEKAPPSEIDKVHAVMLESDQTVFKSTYGKKLLERIMEIKKVGTNTDEKDDAELNNTRSCGY